MPPTFTKFHGLGNDYIVLESVEMRHIEDLGDFAKRICNRHYGAGADGIAIVGEPASPKQTSMCASSIPMAVKRIYRETARAAQRPIFTTTDSGKLKS
jgi:hypothetical protein